MKKIKGFKGFRVAFTVITVFLFFIIASIVLIHFEKKHEDSNINNFPDAIWYSIVTLTTVGYGDKVPVSHIGRVIGSVFVIVSVGLYGYLISQLTIFFRNMQENQKLGYNGTKFSNHAVIIGWNDFAKVVTEQLVLVGNKVAIVTNDKDSIDLIYKDFDQKQVYVLFTNFDNLELLKKANIQIASAVFINLDNDTEKLVYILNLKKKFYLKNFVVMLDNANLKDTFYGAGVSYIVSKNEISSRLVASFIFEPDVANYCEDIMSYPVDDEDYDIKQYKVISKNPFIDHKYKDVFLDLKKKYNCILIGLSKEKGGKRKLLKNPEGDIKVELYDYLIIITNGKSQKFLAKDFGIKEGILDN